MGVARQSDAQGGGDEGHVVAGTSRPLHLVPNKPEIMITDALQIEAIFVLAVASERDLSALEPPTDGERRHNRGDEQAVGGADDLPESGAAHGEKTLCDLALSVV